MMFRATLLVMMAGLAVGFAPAALGQNQTAEATPNDAALPQPAPPEPTEADGERRRITGFTVHYVRPNPNLPTPEAVLEATVELVETPEGYIAPPPLEERGLPEAPTVVRIRLADFPTLENQWLFDSALARIAPAVVERLQDLGLIGVYVEPSPDQFAVVEGKVVDLRPPDETGVQLDITTGIVTDMRTIGMADDLPEDERINHPRHARIRARSPVAPEPREAPEEGPDGEAEAVQRPDVLRRDLIDDYVHRLNRHPGRRVDVAVAPTGTEFGGVTLDYLVAENRPWFLYAQIANTGTASTDRLRERFGFVHNQLTNSDDIFSIDYLTANFDELHAVNVSYQRPFPETERWWWRVYGGWSEYTATDVGVQLAQFKGESWAAGGEVIWNIEQVEDLFIDVVVGARWEQISVDNRFAGIEGETDFVIPYGGLRLERYRDTIRTFGEVMFETNLSGLADTDPAQIDRLGRLDADTSWLTMRGVVAHSFFLEPLFDPNPEEGGTLSHELAFAVRGQYAFGSRLVPNFQEVAGGLYTVRGYPEAIAAGDNAYVLNAEYRWHIPKGFDTEPQPASFFGRPFRFAPQHQYGPTDWDLIARVFVDFGQTFDNDRLPFERNQTLLGTGVGAEIQLSRHFSARVDWGFALHDVEDALGNDLVEAGDDRVHFVVTLVY